ncbi:pentapeptide repeat-containing protein [Leptolyngbya sp. Heron Island J]|uniref:pentapeptide repeat-containing protein n=1 Tax=Leptolyngbya sp. Heron Island J TaxID=1385935 RepID=UPI001377F5CF|nr:pentapeptide repeat-containing protein [Leptolyngbya sp. Heron Island J]
MRTILFLCNRPFIKLEKHVLEPILTWANNLALLDLLGLVGNVGLIIAVGMYIGSEKQRRDTEVFTAWQTLTNAHGQPGNGGRIHALEFLNASPRNKAYDYPGANWRRRASCLWICTWRPESLAGINLSIESVDDTSPEPTSILPEDEQLNDLPSQVYLVGIQLPNARLPYSNLSGVDLRSSNLSGTVLLKANLADADLRSANLSNSLLFRVNLTDASLFGANLADADLRNANLVDADLGGANLVGADLGLAKLSGAYLFQTNFVDSNLQFADLSGSYMAWANLSGADLYGINLSGAYLVAANLESASGLTQEELTHAKLCFTKLPSGISLSANRDCEELGIDPALEELIFNDPFPIRPPGGW